MRDSMSAQRASLPADTWKRALLVMVAANLITGLVFSVVVQLFPSWIVYPSFLLIGAWRLRKGGTTGTIFLFVTALIFVLVHFPYTPFGPEGSACAAAGCPRGLAWIALTVVPILTAVVAAIAWQQSRPVRSQG